MARTYEKIVSTTLGSAAADVTFNSINSTYTDLVLVSSILGVTSQSYSPRVRFNSDTTSNYSVTYMYGTGSTTGTGRGSDASFAYIGHLIGYPVTGSPMTIITQIQNYSNTNVYKTLVSRSNNINTDIDAIVGMWRSNSAITSINIAFQSGTNFQAGSTFSIYGIKKAV
jgi:hypothetical protein